MEEQLEAEPGSETTRLFWVRHQMPPVTTQDWEGARDKPLTQRGLGESRQGQVVVGRLREGDPRRKLTSHRVSGGQGLSTDGYWIQGLSTDRRRRATTRPAPRLVDGLDF